jgi:serine/threonine protein kinase
MTTQNHCVKCAAPLTSVGNDVLCPGCLLEAGLIAQPDGTQTAATDSEAQSEIRNPKSEIGSPFIRFFGNYELLEEIARGGMGIVYKARQVGLDRLVAVKMLLFGPLARPEFVQRFRAEAAAAASLRHPNIVAIHEVGYRDGQHFFAMDYVEGQNLAMLVANQPLPARRAAAYVKTIAEAIHFAHEWGVLHRDLKPSNFSSASRCSVRRRASSV